MIGLEPNDSSSLHLTRGGSGRHRKSSSAIPSACQASIGLGFSPSTLGKGTVGSFNQMGNFATQDGCKLNTEDHFAVPFLSLASLAFARLIGLTWTASSGPGRESKRGRKKDESYRVASGVPAPVELVTQYNGNFEPVALLQATVKRWDRKAFRDHADSPEMVDRKVKSLLNKLAMIRFDSISDQIIQWADRSENEKDGRTLIQVIKLVFEMATDQMIWCEMYARLCTKMIIN
jgi:translation initiation factor 4G